MTQTLRFLVLITHFLSYQDCYLSIKIYLVSLCWWLKPLLWLCYCMGLRNLIVKEGFEGVKNSSFNPAYIQLHLQLNGSQLFFSYSHCFTNIGFLCLLLTYVSSSSTSHHPSSPVATTLHLNVNTIRTLIKIVNVYYELVCNLLELYLQYVHT